MTFPDAVEYLAGIAGLDMPAYTPQERQKDDERKLLFSALNDAQDFFVRSLQGTDGADVRKYLDARRIDQKTVAKWGIGFAPLRPSSLPDALKRHKMSILIKAGLIRENARGTYGFYRNRLTFPIRDRQGRVISFGARAIQADQKPKYVNGQDSPVFHKSRTLYGLDVSSSALGLDRNANGLILSEGYLDVIAFARAGIPLGVAPLGTSVTDDHLTELWRWGPEPIICLDGDKAGYRAAGKVIEKALPRIGAGRTILFAQMPAGQDPDDVLRQGGPDALKSIIRNPVPMPRLIWERERDAEPLDTPERRAAFKARLNEQAGLIKDKETLRHYKDAFYRWTRDHYRRGQKNASQTLRSGGVVGHRGVGILISCIDNPKLIEEIDMDLAMAEWSPECKAIFDLVFLAYRNDLEINRDKIIDGLLVDMNTNAADILESYPRGRVLEPGGRQWQSIKDSVWLLRKEEHKPKSLADAMREQTVRRGITKK